MLVNMFLSYFWGERLNTFIYFVVCLKPWGCLCGWIEIYESSIALHNFVANAMCYSYEPVRIFDWTKYWTIGFIRYGTTNRILNNIYVSLLVKAFEWYPQSAKTFD